MVKARQKMTTMRSLVAGGTLALSALLAPAVPEAPAWKVDGPTPLTTP